MELRGLKQFYNLSKNLVIENYSNNKKIEFNEDFLLDGNYIENFKDKNDMYKLISVINRIEGVKNDNKKSQIGSNKIIWHCLDSILLFY